MDTQKPKRNKPGNYGPNTNGVVSVTQQHIDEAQQQISSHCMVTRALYDYSRGRFKRIGTDLQTIRWSDPTTDKRYEMLTPRSVQLAILMWDAGKKPLPFKFLIKATRSTPMMHDDPRNTKRLLGEPVKREKAKTVIQSITSGPHSRKKSMVEGGKMSPTLMRSRRGFGIRAFPYNNLEEMLRGNGETEAPATAPA